MTFHPLKLGFAFAIGCVLVLSAMTQGAQAQDRPQEVRDLIAAHDALAMKIRPLHDRVIVARPKKEKSTGFKPEGAPLRAKVGTASSENTGGRASERLRHKDRAATSGDEYGHLKVQFLALEKKAKAERERVNNPKFGVGLRAVLNINAARGVLAGLQLDLAAIEQETAALEARN